jgi:excisionase family DNA binding protein
VKTIHPGVTGSCATSVRLEPLAVTPRQACILLGVGNTRLYQLIGNRELESYLDGRGRRITMESIRRRVARLVADADAIPAPTEGIVRRRRGRPSKISSATATP